MKALSDFLRPEFLSRIDEVIVFRPLDEEDYRKIAALMLNEYVGSLKEKGITLTFDEGACQVLAAESIHGKSGARDLRNNIRRQVEDRIAMPAGRAGRGRGHRGGRYRPGGPAQRGRPVKIFEKCASAGVLPAGRFFLCREMRKTLDG